MLVFPLCFKQECLPPTNIELILNGVMFLLIEFGQLTQVQCNAKQPNCIGPVYASAYDLWASCFMSPLVHIFAQGVSKCCTLTSIPDSIETMADDVDGPPIDIANVLGGLILEICIGLM